MSALQHDSNADIASILQSSLSSRDQLLPTHPDPITNYNWTESNHEQSLSWKGSLRQNDASKQSLKNPPTTAELSNISLYPPLSGKTPAKSSRTSQLDRKTASNNHNNDFTRTLISTTPSIAPSIISHHSSRSGAVRQLFTSTTNEYITTSVSGTRMSINVSTKPILSSNSLSKASDSVMKSISAPRISSCNNRQVVTTAEKVNMSSSGVSKVSSSTVSTVSGSSLSTNNVNISASCEQTQNVIDQIMKTPSIFQEAASQISQPKKYSDAVGKKQASDVSSHPSHCPVQPTIINGCNKINLAPGSRPIGGDQTLKVCLFEGYGYIKVYSC